MQVFLQVLTLFSLMFIGFFAAKSRLLQEMHIQGLNLVVLNFAMPAMILRRMQIPATGTLLRDLGLVFLLTCATMIAAGCIAWRLFRRSAPPRRAVLSNLSMASNCAFMGFPVITAALGEEALIYAVMFSVAFNAVCWTVGAYFYGGRQAMRPRQLMKNPTIWAVLAGLVLLLTGLTLPSFINGALDLLSSLTTPLTMITIGARLITLKRKDLTDLPLLAACGLRLLVFPLLVLLLSLTGLPAVIAHTLFICTAMPGAALIALQSETLGGDKSLASRGVALSTALSIGTIPLLLLLI